MKDRSVYAVFEHVENFFEIFLKKCLTFCNGCCRITLAPQETAHENETQPKAKGH